MSSVRVIRKARMAPCATCGANPMEGERTCGLGNHPIEGGNDYRPVQ